MKAGFLLSSSLVLVAIFSLGNVSCLRDGRDPEVEKVLQKISDLVIDHYNIPAHRAEATPESKEMNERLDDIRYTLPQAKSILRNLQKHWGYPVTEEDEPRILPDTSMFWEFPIKYAFNYSDHSLFLSFLSIFLLLILVID